MSTTPNEYIFCHQPPVADAVTHTDRLTSYTSSAKEIFDNFISMVDENGNHGLPINPHKDGCAMIFGGVSDCQGTKTENVKAITLAMVDIDAASIADMDRFHDELDALRVEYATYMTHSAYTQFHHGIPGKEKRQAGTIAFRTILPLSEPVEAARYPAFLEHLASKFAWLPFDPTMTTVARRYYVYTAASEAARDWYLSPHPDRPGRYLGHHVNLHTDDDDGITPLPVHTVMSWPRLPKSLWGKGEPLHGEGTSKRRDYPQSHVRDVAEKMARVCVKRGDKRHAEWLRNACNFDFLAQPGERQEALKFIVGRLARTDISADSTYLFLEKSVASMIAMGWRAFTLDSLEKFITKCITEEDTKTPETTKATTQEVLDDDTRMAIRLSRNDGMDGVLTEEELQDLCRRTGIPRTCLSTSLITRSTNNQTYLLTPSGYERYAVHNDDATVGMLWRKLIAFPHNVCRMIWYEPDPETGEMRERWLPKEELRRKHEYVHPVNEVRSYDHDEPFLAHALTDSEAYPLNVQKNDLILPSGYYTDVAPEHDEEIEKFLELVAGEKIKALEMHLALGTCHHIHGYMPALLLQGEGGTGKDKIIDGVKIFRGRRFTPFKDVIGTYNGEAGDSPMIVGEEGTSSDNPWQTTSIDTLKRIITESSRKYRNKYGKEFKVLGQVLLYFSVNSASSFAASLNADAADNAAANLRRFLFVPVRSSPDLDAIRSILGMNVTDEDQAVISMDVLERRLAGHYAWLQKVKYKLDSVEAWMTLHRKLLAFCANDTSLIETLLTASDDSQNLLDSIARYLVKPECKQGKARMLAPPGQNRGDSTVTWPLLVWKGQVFVSVNAFKPGASTIIDDKSEIMKWTVKHMRDVLRSISPAPDSYRLRTPQGEQRRYWPIKTSALAPLLSEVIGRSVEDELADLELAQLKYMK